MESGRKPAGSFTDVVTIEDRTGPERNDAGQPVSPYLPREDAVDLWARVEDLSAALAFQAAAAGVKAKVLVSFPEPIELRPYDSQIVWLSPMGRRDLRIVHVRLVRERTREHLEVFCDEAA